MRVKVVSIGPDLTSWIEQIVQNHYSCDLHYYYKTTIIYNLQANYSILVLYNMLEHPRYHLGVVVLDGS